MTPRVSIVIVTFRSREHLAHCLGSLASVGEPHEVIIVDNASGDATAELARELLPDARVLANERNRGFAAAVNQAVREARGDFLLLLNPDAVLGEGAVTALLRAMEPGVGLAGARLVSPDGTPQACAWVKPGLAMFAYDALLLRNLAPRSRLDHVEAPQDGPPITVACLSGACLLVRRETWQALGGLDERFFLYHEDWDLCLRARAAGWGVRLVPAARARHVLAASADQDRAASLARFHESRDAFIRKHWPGARGEALVAIHRTGILVRILVYGIAGALGARGRAREARHHVALLTRPRAAP